MLAGGYAGSLFDDRGQGMPRIPYQRAEPREYMDDGQGVVPPLSYPTAPPADARAPGVMSGLYRPLDTVTNTTGQALREATAYADQHGRQSPVGSLLGKGMAYGAQGLLEAPGAVMRTLSAPYDWMMGNKVDATGGDLLATGVLGAGAAVRGVRGALAQDDAATYMTRDLRTIRNSIPLAVRSPPQSSTGASLSKNNASSPNEFHYDMYKDGQYIGYTTGSVGGKSAHIGWIGNDDVKAGANSIGVSGVKQLREQIRTDFPDVKVFSGNRISGARRGPAAMPGANPNQRVRINQLAPWIGGGSVGYELYGEPGGLGAALRGGEYAGQEGAQQ